MAAMDFEPAIAAIPDALQDNVREWLAAHAVDTELAGVLQTHPDIALQLPRVIACSSYLTDVLGRYPSLLGELLNDGRLQRPLADRELDGLLGELVDPGVTETECMRQLRMFRHRELLRIAWRDLNNMANVPETLAELSSLADTVLRVALDRAAGDLAKVYGLAHEENGAVAEFVILAMGKLGGRELNFSSDVDLVFLYTDQGYSSGPRQIENEQYFRLLAQRIIRLLSHKTADGFVYRVDVRLRPFGDAGPLAVSLPAFEAYLLTHGRDWERYAYVKARVVNDWDDAGRFDAEILRPFVYRRYLDYGVFSSLRDMKAMIEAEGRRREYSNNLKLGPGGIREIEFIVQSLQLVRGGTIAELRERELRRALPALVRHGLLPERAADELWHAYELLRRVENCLQAIADRQTHDLPDDEQDRDRLAFATGHGDWPALLKAVDEVRAIVAAHFRDIVFRGSEQPEQDSVAARLAVAWAEGMATPDVNRLLEQAGLPDAEPARRQLQALHDSSQYRRMDEAGRQRLDALIPRLVLAAGREEQPLRALSGAIRVVQAIGRRSAYLALLNENPAALRRLVQLCALSEFLVQQLEAHPLLLDELLDPRIFSEPPDRDELQAELSARLNCVDEADHEQRLYAVVNFQQAATFRVAVADLSGSLPLMKVSDRLTDIAELVLQAALDLAMDELVERHGVPRCIEGGKIRRAGFAIVGYGKLGGLELGYGSDLDLVFVHDSTGSKAETDGQRPLDNAVFFGRLTRRIIHVLTLSTPSGRMYEVDTRLRPSGKSGLLVSSLAALERYQREDAWTWEHQALLRSRAVAGDAAVCNAFEALRRRILVEYVRRDSLKQDVSAMRERMRSELSRGTRELFDLKQDPGGIADIEFIVQYLVLQHAREHPELVAWSDNVRQLEALARCGILSEAEARQLSATYRQYRAFMHRLSLAGEPPLVPRAEVASLAARIIVLRESVFG